MTDHALSGQPASPQPFRSFSFESHLVRVITLDGDPWFVAADVCTALGLSNPTVSVQALDEDERAKFNLGRQGEATIISEGGLYTLILRSRDAVRPGTVPHRFRKWVTTDVIPAIRKGGSYAVPGALQINVRDPSQLATIAIQLIEVNRELEGKLADIAPKAEAHDRIADAHGTFCRSTAAKMLGIPPQTLIRWLNTNGWTFRRPGDKDDLAYQSKIAAGLLEHKIKTGPRPDGTEWVSTQVRVTAKGMTVLAKAFPPVASAA